MPITVIIYNIDWIKWEPPKLSDQTKIKQRIELSINKSTWTPMSKYNRNINSSFIYSIEICRPNKSGGYKFKTNLIKNKKIVILKKES